MDIYEIGPFGLDIYVLDVITSNRIETLRQVVPGTPDALHFGVYDNTDKHLKTALRFFA